MESLRTKWYWIFPKELDSNLKLDIFKDPNEEGKFRFNNSYRQYSIVYFSYQQ